MRCEDCCALQPWCSEEKSSSSSGRVQGQEPWPALGEPLFMEMVTSEGASEIENRH